MSRNQIRAWQAFLAIVVFETVLVTPTPRVLQIGSESLADVALHYGVGFLLMGLPLLQSLVFPMRLVNRPFWFWANIAVPGITVLSAAAAANIAFVFLRDPPVQPSSTIQIVNGWIGVGLLIQSVLFAVANILLLITTCIAACFNRRP